jgi:hypothetical protein
MDDFKIIPTVLPASKVILGSRTKPTELHLDIYGRIHFDDAVLRAKVHTKFGMRELIRVGGNANWSRIPLTTERFLQLVSFAPLYSLEEWENILMVPLVALRAISFGAVRQSREAGNAPRVVYFLPGKFSIRLVESENTVFVTAPRKYNKYDLSECGPVMHYYARNFAINHPDIFVWKEKENFSMQGLIKIYDLCTYVTNEPGKWSVTEWADLLGTDIKVIQSMVTPGKKKNSIFFLSGEGKVDVLIQLESFMNNLRICNGIMSVTDCAKKYHTSSELIYHFVSLYSIDLIIEDGKVSITNY